MRDTMRRTFRDHGLPYASQAAFAFAFSLFPLVYVIATVTGLLVRDGRLRGKLLMQLGNFMPVETVQSVAGYLMVLQSRYLGTQLAISVLIGLWTASGVVVVWGEAIRRAYRVRIHRSFWKKRVRALFVLLTVGLLISAAFGFLVLVPVITKFLTKHLGMGSFFLQMLDMFGFPLAVLCMSPAYAVLYWMAPAKHADGAGYVWPGALFATWLWVAVTYVFRLFIVNFASFNQMYGSIAGFMILLSWMYITSLTVMVGAEFNVVFHRYRARNMRIRPQPLAPDDPTETV